MAGARDIRAGSAFIEIHAKIDTLKKDLAQGTAQLRTWGSNLQSVGGMVSGIFAGIGTSAVVTGLVSTFKAFTDIGGALHDMSVRTGKSTTDLQHLSFAAKQSDASIQDVEMALRNMARNGFDVAKFEEIGQSIAAIKDPSERSAKAMDVFGKSGTKLLPMFAEYKSLKASSIALGPILTADEVRRADEMGDAVGALAEAYARLKQRIGSLHESKVTLDVLTGALVELNQNLAGDFGDIKSSGNPFQDIADMFVRLSKKGAAATAGFEVPGGMGEGDIDFDERGTEKTAKTWDDILESVRRAHEERNRLIQSFDTPAEQFLRRQQEIIDAMKLLNRHRVLSFVGDDEAKRQREGLNTAMHRLRFQEQERRLAELPRMIEMQTRHVQTSSKGTFSAAGAALLGRGGDAVEKSQLDELKAIRKAVEKPIVQRARFT